MEQTEWMIGLITSFVVLIAVLKSRANMVLRFLVQSVLGGILIYGMNQFFLAQNVVSIIALNPLTVLTCGFLGFPGGFTAFLYSDFKHDIKISQKYFFAEKGLDKQGKSPYNRNYFKSPLGLYTISGDF